MDKCHFECFSFFSAFHVSSPPAASCTQSNLYFCTEIISLLGFSSPTHTQKKNSQNDFWAILSIFGFFSFTPFFWGGGPILEAGGWI